LRKDNSAATTRGNNTEYRITTPKAQELQQMKVFTEAVGSSE